MSTNDCPGFKPQNNDALAGGCWAEHADGSLIYVQANEGGKVIFEVFDMSGPRPVEFRDAMPESAFKRKFSWNPSDPKSVKWTWHDKTPFPWSRILGKFSEGVKPVSADVQLEEADAVAAARQKVTGRRSHASGKRTRAARKRARAAIVKTLTPAAPRQRDARGKFVPTVAQQLATERKLEPMPVEHADVAHKEEITIKKGGLADRMRSGIQRAINRLRPGKGE